MDTIKQVRFIWKPIVFLLCLLPLFFAVGDLYGVTGTLGANPVENLQDRFGNWGLRFMLIALAVTPLRLISGQNWLTIHWLVKPGSKA